MTSPDLDRRYLAAATLILVLAAALRLHALADVPPGLSQDEVLDADIASFILNGYHALFFREGYGHEPLYHYWAAPFQYLLGDNLLSIRLPAVSLGLFLIAATIRWARRKFGQLPALVAGAGLAISWWPIIFSRIGLRPILLPVLLVGFAWFWPRRPWLAGLFLGLTLYSYTAARVVFLIPLAMIGHAWLLRRHPGRGVIRGRRLRAVGPAVVTLLAAVLISLPLFLTLRADPTLQQRVEQLAGPLEALQAGDPGPILQTTRATLGVFSFTGDPRWTYTVPNRPLFDPATSLLFYGGLLLALGRWRRPRYALLVVWLATGLLPSAVTPQAPSTVRLVGAMPVVYLLPGLATGWLWRRYSEAGGRRPVFGTGHGAAQRLLLMATVLFFVAALNLFLTWRDGFVRWPADLETHVRYQTIWLDMSRRWESAPAGGLTIAESYFEPIDHDTFRRNLGRPIDVRWVQDGRAIVLPATGGAPAHLYVPEYAPPAPELMTAVGLSEMLYQSEGEPSFAAYRLPLRPEDVNDRIGVTWNDALTLLDARLLEPTSGQPLQLLTTWRVEQQLPWDLAAFVHLVAEDGTIAAQYDGLDAAPMTLQPGDVLFQLHPLPWPEVAGPFRLQIGLYTRQDGQRWLSDHPPRDHYVLFERLLFDER